MGINFEYFYYILRALRSDLRLQMGVKRVFATIFTTFMVALSLSSLCTPVVDATAIVSDQTENGIDSEVKNIAFSEHIYENNANLAEIRTTEQSSQNFQRISYAATYSAVATTSNNSTSARDLYVPGVGINVNVVSTNASGYLTCQNSYEVCEYSAAGRGIYLYGHNYRSLGRIANMSTGQTFTYKGATYQVTSNVILDNQNSNSGPANSYLNTYRRSSGVNELMMQTCANANGTLIRFVRAVRI